MNYIHCIPGIMTGLALVEFINRRRKITLDYDRIISRLHPHQLRNKDRYLGEEGAADKEIFAATDGYRGLWRRWRNRIPLIRLCQIRYRDHGVPQKEMDELLSEVSALTYLTFKAAALASIRQYAPEMAQKASFSAFHLYGEIADHTHVLFAEDSVHGYAMSLSSLL